MDADSIKFMEDVKKKKLRKFVLIAKGVSILQLVVFRKGQFTTQLQKALKSGPKGPGRFWGIAEGSGVDVVFKLSIDDGFTVDPVKPIALKAYLKEHTGTAFKPRFEFVSQAALDAAAKEAEESDPLGDTANSSPTGDSMGPVGQDAAASPAPVTDSPATATAAEPAQAEQSPAGNETNEPTEAAVQAGDGDAGRRAELQQQFDALTAKVAAAVSAYPAESEDLEELASEFRQSLSVNDLIVAAEWLEKLTEALDDLPEQAPSSAAPALAGNDSAEASVGQDDSKEFAQRFKALLPKIKQAAGTPLGDEAKRIASQAAGLAQAKDYTQAGGFLDQIDSLFLQAPAPGIEANSDAVSAEAAELAESLKQLKPKLQEAVTQHAEFKAELVAAAKKLANEIRLQQLPAARQSLEQLQAKISELLSATNAPPPSPPPLPVSDPAAEFTSRLTALMPQLKAAINSSVGDKLKELANDARGQSAKGEHEQASAGLDKLAVLLNWESRQRFGQEFEAAWTAARQSWVEATDSVNDQISMLVKQLKASSDPDLESIAEFGLNALTANLRTPLEVAIREVDACKDGDRQAAVAKAIQAVQAIEAHLSSDERVLVCDENPFEVPVSIRATLGSALAKMSQTLQA